jgi:aminobenzoyl-glutamate transport protein
MKSLIQRGLGFIERTGNKLPDPVSLFIILIGLVLLLSCVCALLEWRVIHPGSGETIQAVNLFSAEWMRRLLVEMPQTFASFPPLGLVLVVMLGIGVADKSGLIITALKLLVAKIPHWLLSGAVVFAGIMSSLAFDVGYVVLIPLGAVLFYGAGRHPLAGLAAAFAGVSAGYTANLLLTAVDPVLAGLTQAAAQLLVSDYEVPITANYYFMMALVPLFTVVGALLTEWVVEPRLQSIQMDGNPYLKESFSAITAKEKQALIAAAITGLLVCCAIALMVIPDNGWLRDVDGGYESFYKSLVGIMLFIFLIPGLIYGVVTGSIRSDRDAVKMSADSMADMAHYIVLAFLAAHLIVLFKWSNLGLMIAITGANGLIAMQFTGLPLLVTFIAVVALINLFIGSASAKWGIIAPVFVPMFMLLGYSPELTQAAYRIGDSITNILTPLMPYFPLVIVFARKYSSGLGMGTLATMMLPYSLGFGMVATVLLVIWVALDLPLGPGVALQLGG